jgi:hypothetical protein
MTAPRGGELRLVGPCPAASLPHQRTLGRRISFCIRIQKALPGHIRGHLEDGSSETIEPPSRFKMSRNRRGTKAPQSQGYKSTSIIVARLPSRLRAMRHSDHAI